MAAARKLGSIGWHLALKLSDVQSLRSKIRGLAATGAGGPHAPPPAKPAGSAPFWVPINGARGRREPSAQPWPAPATRRLVARFPGLLWEVLPGALGGQLGRIPSAPTTQGGGGNPQAPPGKPPGAHPNSPGKQLQPVETTYTTSTLAPPLLPPLLPRLRHHFSHACATAYPTLPPALLLRFPHRFLCFLCFL